MNRKLIRPKLAEIQNRPPSTGSAVKRESVDLAASSISRRKQIPPEQTNAENFYYIKQMATKSPVVVVMSDGEVIKGILEWYDRDCLKINRYKEPNLVVRKQYVKYMYKENERK